MVFAPVFPTKLHHDTAGLVSDFFYAQSIVDTVLIVNSCARGQGVPESDLDFAILVKPGTTTVDIKNLEALWQACTETQLTVLSYKASSPFAHLHLDVIRGNYTPVILEPGEITDYFEIGIGNQVCYSAPMNEAGTYFKELQQKWLPYYNGALRLQRLESTIKACTYNLNHISFFIKRGLYFHAFDILCRAFQEYLQALFIANETYPIAYNKWIK